MSLRIFDAVRSVQRFYTVILNYWVIGRHFLEKTKNSSDFFV